MAHRGVELVARAVEVGRHQVDGALAVLVPVGLELGQLGELGHAVRGVRLLGVALPQRVLVERHRGELRVRADRADHHRLGDAEPPGGVEHVGPHQQVVEVQVRRAHHVGADAADPRRQVDDQVRVRGRRASRRPPRPRAGRTPGRSGVRRRRGTGGRARASTADPRNPPPPVTSTRRVDQNSLMAPNYRRPTAGPRGPSPVLRVGCSEPSPPNAERRGTMPKCPAPGRPDPDAVLASGTRGDRCSHPRPDPGHASTPATSTSSGGSVGLAAAGTVDAADPRRTHPHAVPARVRHLAPPALAQRRAHRRPVSSSST